MIQIIILLKTLRLWMDLVDISVKAFSQIAHARARAHAHIYILVSCKQAISCMCYGIELMLYGSFIKIPPFAVSLL